MKNIKANIIAYLPIVSILLLGAFLRLYQIDKYMTFLGDEGRDVMIVKHMIVDGKWTLLGPTASVGGFFMGPIYYYFMLPFLWAWRLNPVGPAIMVALFGIATIFLVYHAGYRIFSKRVGLIASLLYALSPVVIAYSRSSWNPNIVPFFALLAVYISWRVVRHESWRELFWVGILAGIGIQLHYTFLFLIVALLVWVLLQRQFVIRLRAYALGIAGFFIGFSPFLAFELRHGFTNTKSIFEFVFAGKDTGFAQSHFFMNISDIYFRLFGRLILRIPESGVLGNLPPNIKIPWIAITWFLAFLCGGLLLHRSIIKLNGKQKNFHNEYILMLLWITVPILLFGVYKKAVYDYYFGLFFPLPFLLTALVIDRLMYYKKAGLVVGACIILGLAIFNWQGRPFVYQPNNQLGQVELISREVLAHAEGKPYNFALIATGNSDQAYRYFFEIWGKAPVTIENAVIDPERKTVTDQLLIVCEDIFCKPLGHSLWEIAGFGRAEIAGVWDVSVVKVYKLIHYKGQ
jgi:4-amino-4-deoxy-L-arabinose transferase-like glycosyltransferase